MSRQPSHRDRFFTPEEANAELPRVRLLVSQMSSALERARGLVRDLGVRDRAALSQHPRRGEIDELQQEILAAQSQLTELGVEVKGGEPALVDFPGLRHGVEVCLCWKEGEEQVEHWHPVHTGYAGRAPIGETPAEAWHWSH